MLDVCLRRAADHWEPDLRLSHGTELMRVARPSPLARHILDPGVHVSRRVRDGWQACQF